MNQDQKTIDELTDDYRRLWRHEPISVEDFLSQNSLSGEGSSQAKIRLIKHEIELRRSAGERCSASEYQERFPNVDAEVLNNLFSMPAPPPVSVLKPLLPNRYQPIKQIGKGGIGSVWQVDDRDMNRTLAVKVLHTKLEKETSANLRLKREAMLTGSLQHPGIPPVFEYGSLVGGSNYFAMKLVEGETLDRTFEKQSGPELLAIFRQVAEAVGFAHSRNVIHRDLKPQNIMVGAFGEVQIMDWGLAKDLNARKPTTNNGKAALKTSPQSEIETSDNSIDSSYVGVNSELTRHGDVVGTPAYMSPEQALGEVDSLGPATDVYSLGAMLFEILTGKRWYRIRPDNTAPAELDAVLTANLDSDTIADQLADLCKQCLHPDQSKRPADGSEVAQLVADYQSKLAQRLKETEIDRAKAEAMTEEVRKRSRLRLGMLAAILVTGLMGVAAVAWYQIDQANKRNAIVSDLEVAKERLELFRDRGDFESAEQTVTLIESKTDGLGDKDLSKQVEVLKQDNKLLKFIDKVRQRRRLLAGKSSAATWRKAKFIGQTPEYRKAITEVIGDIENEKVESLVDSINQSALKPHIVAAIDEWASFETDESLRKRLLEVNVAADPDPLRDRIRNEENWSKPDVLYELAKLIDPKAMGSSTLILLAEKIHALPEPEAQIMEMTHSEFVKKSVSTREALMLLERSLPWHQDDFWIHMRLGFMTQYLELDEDASAYFMAAAAIRAHDGHAFYYLSNVKDNLGRSTAAESSMKRVIELSGPLPTFYESLGNIQSARGRKEGKFSNEAVATFKKALELAPDSRTVNYNLGTCYQMFDRSREALPYFRKAIAIDPSYTWARTNLATCLLMLGEFKEAEEVLRPLATKEGGAFQEAHVRYGQILMALERFDESKPHFERALALAEKPRGAKSTVKFLKHSISNWDNYKRISKQFLDSPNEISPDDALLLIEFYQHDKIQKDRVAKLFKHVLENHTDEVDAGSLNSHRYNASCVAATLESSNEEWRGFALTQLSKVLDHFEDAIESLPNKESERQKATTQMVGFLEQWNGDSGLAPVRDKLESLSDAEGKSWRSLWKRHAEVLLSLKNSTMKPANNSPSAK